MTDDMDMRDLVRRMQHGDVNAMAAMYDRQAKAVYSLAYRIVRNHADAEEVVQDAFMQAWRQAATFDHARGTVRGWLLIIARSRGIDRVRRSYGRTRWEASSNPPRGDPLSRSDSAADEALIRDDNGRELREHFDALPASHRIPLELAFYQGLTHVEIAAVLRQPLGTIKTRIRLALHRVREGLNGPAADPPGREPSPFAGALAEYLARHPRVTDPYASLDGIQILVVDDDAETVEMTATVLQSMGASVRTARSTSEALGRLDAAWPDLILADIVMPVADGYALIRQVRALADASERSLTAVAFTGRADHQRALDAGFAAVVAKPVQPHRLLEVVARVAGRAA